jgi:tetratricopeptide (TPR) repeat protein
MDGIYSIYMIAARSWWMPRFSWILAFAALLCISFGSAAQAADRSVDLGLLTVKERALADKLRASLLKGGSFETLAKKYSVGPGASRGGRLGNIAVTRLRGEFRRALADLPANKPSAVILTEEGYTILMRFDQPQVAKALHPRPGTLAPIKPEAPAPRPPASGPPQIAARSEVMAALEFMVAGHMDIAKVHLERARKQNPAEDSATFLQGIVLPATAGKLRKEAVQTLASGFVAMTEADAKTALTDFTRARELDPNLWQARLLEANLRAGIGDRIKALALLEQVLMANPGSARAYMSLGRMAMERGDEQEALKNLNKALEIEPTLSEAHYHLAALELAHKRLKKAEAELNKTLKINPYNEDALSDLAMLYAATNRTELAEKAYRKTLDLNPAFALSHVNLGILYLEQDKLNQALEEFEKAMLIDPGMATTHYHLAVVFTLKEDWPKAILHADQAVKLGYKVPKKHLDVLKRHRRSR